MKHLLRIDELKKSTYLSAAERLRQKGGKHKERARNLVDYANSPDVQTLDKFSFKLYEQGGNLFAGSGPKRGSQEKEVMAKMRQIYCMDIELLDLKEFELEDIEQLTISFQFDFDNYETNIVPFALQVRVKLEGEILKTKGKAEIVEEYFGGVALFSNRRDASRFKRMILNEDFLMDNCPEFDRIRELYMMYSTGSAEYLKFVNAITSISVNDLWS
jgi:hypothetical protein